MHSHRSHARPGPAINAALQRAYDVFNVALWAQTERGTLPDCVLLWARKPRSLGYFSRDRWTATGAATRAHEIALNPDHIRGALESGSTSRLVDALSTIPHEQCHLWQAERGLNRPRKAYHNREFAAEMLRIGLQCSDTGHPGGRETGAKMSHYVIDGGLVDRTARAMLADGFTFDWSSIPATETRAPGARQGRRCKYVAPCADAVWGKEGLTISCQCVSCRGAPFAPTP